MTTSGGTSSEYGVKPARSEKSTVIVRFSLRKRPSMIMLTTEESMVA